MPTCLRTLNRGFRYAQWATFLTNRWILWWSEVSGGFTCLSAQSHAGWDRGQREFGRRQHYYAFWVKLLQLFSPWLTFSNIGGSYHLLPPQEDHLKASFDSQSPSHWLQCSTVQLGFAVAIVEQFVLSNQGHHPVQYTSLKLTQLVVLIWE